MIARKNFAVSLTEIAVAVAGTPRARFAAWGARRGGERGGSGSLTTNDWSNEHLTIATFRLRYENEYEFDFLLSKQSCSQSFRSSLVLRTTMA